MTDRVDVAWFSGFLVAAILFVSLGAYLGFYGPDESDYVDYKELRCLDHSFMAK